MAEYSVRARVLNFEDVGVAAPFADAWSVILRKFVLICTWYKIGKHRNGPDIKLLWKNLDSRENIMTRLASPGETEKFRDRRGGYVINPASQPYLPKPESILARCKFCLGVPNISKYFSLCLKLSTDVSVHKDRTGGQRTWCHYPVSWCLNKEPVFRSSWFVETAVNEGPGERCK